MTWIECPAHTTVYYDSRVHEICPACLSYRLAVALMKSSEVSSKTRDFAQSILEWSGAGLDLISSLSERKAEARSKAETAFLRASECLERLGLMRKDLSNYMRKEVGEAFGKLIFDSGL